VLKETEQMDKEGCLSTCDCSGALAKKTVAKADQHNWTVPLALYIT